MNIETESTELSFDEIIAATRARDPQAYDRVHAIVTAVQARMGEIGERVPTPDEYRAAIAAVALQSIDTAPRPVA